VTKPVVDQKAPFMETCLDPSGSTAFNQAMDRWLRGITLLFPWLVGALALVFFALHPGENDCNGSGPTSTDHAYLTELRWTGGVAALAAVLLIWLLARHGRSLRESSSSATPKIYLPARSSTARIA
jgi:hypothetical protein